MVDDILLVKGCGLVASNLVGFGLVGHILPILVARLIVRLSGNHRQSVIINLVVHLFVDTVLAGKCLFNRKYIRFFELM